MMLWLTWRQHRLQLFALGAVLSALTAYLIYRAQPLLEMARGLRGCAGGTVTESTCATYMQAQSMVIGVDSGLVMTLAAVNLLPALIGVFCGAPLVARELEHGTQRLVWAQSVPRRRWLAIKLTTLGTAALLGGTTQAVLLTWATDQFMVMGTFNRFQDRILFDLVGVVPPVLWLFALFLGTAVGMLVRHTTAAMAITLVLFGVVLAGLNMARPHYEPAQTREPIHVFEGNDVYGMHLREDWILGSVLRRADGTPVAIDAAQRLCPADRNPPGAEEMKHCLSQHGIKSMQLYHPQSQFTRFQWVEATILLAGTLLLAVLLFVRVSRKAD